MRVYKLLIFLVVVYGLQLGGSTGRATLRPSLKSMCERADLIVFGSLRGVKDFTYTERPFGKEGQRVRTYFDRGEIEVSEVLMGETNATSVPVAWYTVSALVPFEPANSGIVVTIDGLPEPPEAGQVGVWILFGGNKSLEGCFRLHFAPANQVDLIKQLIEELDDR